MLNRWDGKMVLVVEDEVINFFYLNELLSDKGLTLINAKSGEEAISLCSTNPNIDLVLMDIQLPGLSGYEAAKSIKTIRKDLPIIAQTAHFLNGEKRKSLKSGCDDYISKPIDTEELFSIFNKFLSH